METAETKTQEQRREGYLKAAVTDPVSMKGAWELKIDIHNTQGTKAFGGRILAAYDHPLTGQITPLVNLNGVAEIGYNIDRPTKILRPDTNLMDRRIVDWLIAHPEVGVEGVTLTDKFLQRKVSNPSIHMKNMDRQEMTHLINEDRIDFVIGRLSDDNPKTGISLDRLRYLLAHFNLPYFDIRYINDKTVEKKFLRTKLKNFARVINKDKSLNADKISQVLDQADNLKYSYEFKEMLRTNVITEYGGMYKFNNVPIGTQEQSAITFMRSNLEVYAEMTGMLYPLLKAEGFRFNEKKE